MDGGWGHAGGAATYESQRPVSLVDGDTVAVVLSMIRAAAFC
jgi:hypothetical protein